MGAAGVLDDRIRVTMQALLTVRSKCPVWVPDVGARCG